MLVPNRSFWIKNRHQLADFRFAGPLGEVPHGLGTPLARAHLERHHLQFFAQLRMADMHFLRHVLNRLIEPQTGFHRDHQHVQRVGQGKAEDFLALLDLLVQKERVAEPTRPCNPRP